MKTVLRILAWAVVAAAIVWWPTRPPAFNARWVSMPAAMSWSDYSSAKAAAARPSFCMPKKCRVG
jgi:hypothetical protein